MSKDITFLSLSQQLIPQNSFISMIPQYMFIWIYKTFKNNLHVDNAHKYSQCNPTGSLHVILPTGWRYAHKINQYNWVSVTLKVYIKILSHCHTYHDWDQWHIFLTSFTKLQQCTCVYITNVQNYILIGYPILYINILYNEDKWPTLLILLIQLLIKGWEANIYNEFSSFY